MLGMEDICKEKVPSGNFTILLHKKKYLTVALKKKKLTVVLSQALGSEGGAL